MDMEERCLGQGSAHCWGPSVKEAAIWPEFPASRGTTGSSLSGHISGEPRLLPSGLVAAHLTVPCTLTSQSLSNCPLEHQRSPHTSSFVSEPRLVTLVQKHFGNLSRQTMTRCFPHQGDRIGCDERCSPSQ